MPGKTFTVYLPEESVTEIASQVKALPYRVSDTAFVEYLIVLGLECLSSNRKK